MRISHLIVKRHLFGNADIVFAPWSKPCIVCIILAFAKAFGLYKLINNVLT